MSKFNLCFVHLNQFSGDIFNFTGDIERFDYTEQLELNSLETSLFAGDKHK